MTSPVPGGTPSAAPQGAESRGVLRTPHTVSGDGSFSQRTVKVPLVILPNEAWRDLRQIAYRCASFGNHLLSESYLKAKGGPKLPTYTDAKGELSAAVRDAMGRECVGLWRRLGRKILRGEQTLARFSADRALVCRDRGVHLTTNGNGQYLIALRLLPQSEGPLTELSVWMPALRRDRFLRELLGKLSEGVHRITKATVQFERPGRKVFIRLSYAKPIATVEGMRFTAAFAVGEDGATFLRCEGRMLSCSDTIHRIAAMKECFAGIHRRLRQGLGKRGRRRDHRKALLRAGSFEAWADGPLHQLSRQIVDWCKAQQAGRLEWSVPDDGEFPWARLRGLVEYKAQECGISLSQIKVMGLSKSPKYPATVRLQVANLRDGE